jgi:hypothetical protein
MSMYLYIKTHHLEVYVIYVDYSHSIVIVNVMRI